VSKSEKALPIILVVFLCLLTLAGVVFLLFFSGPRDYRKNLSIEVKLVRGATGGEGADSEDMLVGVIRNKGNREVTWVDASFSLLDEGGVQVAGRTELLAHNLPFGDNNTPLPPDSAKRFKCPISDVPTDWDGEVKWTITDVVLQ